MEEVIIGIYKITNKIDGKIYIGSSNDIYYRWKRHIRLLNKGTHHSGKFQIAWDKDGSQNFKFEIICKLREEEYDKKLLLDIEQLYIDKYQCFKKEIGYNVSSNTTEYFNVISEFKTLEKEHMGGFVYFMSDSLDELKSIYNNGDLMRLFCLCSYLNSDGCLSFGNGVLIGKKKIKSILKENATCIKSFISKSFNNNILIEKGNKIYVNQKYFYVGMMRNYKEKTVNKDNKIKVYKEFIQNLYKELNPRSMLKFSIIFKLIPYVHFKYNIICSNPETTYIDDVIPLSINDIHKIFYRSNNLHRFEDFIVDSVCAEDHLFKIKDKTVLVNPKMYYRASNPIYLKETLKDFNC